MQIFPKDSPFYSMPEATRAAVIKYVFDMGAAGDMGKMDLGSPVLRPVFRQSAPFFFTLFLFSVLASCGLAGAGSLLWAVAAEGRRERGRQRRRRSVGPGAAGAEQQGQIQRRLPVRHETNFNNII